MLGYTLFNITSYMEKEINNEVTDDEIMLFQIEELNIDCKDMHKTLQNWIIKFADEIEYKYQVRNKKTQPSTHSSGLTTTKKT